MNVRSESLYFRGPSQNIAWPPPSSASKTTKEEPGTASCISCAIFTGTFDTRPPTTRVGTLTNAYASHQSPKAAQRKSLAMYGRGSLSSLTVEGLLRRLLRVVGEELVAKTLGKGDGIGTLEGVNRGQRLIRTEDSITQVAG